MAQYEPKKHQSVNPFGMIILLTLGINIMTKMIMAVATIPKPRQAGCNFVGSTSPANDQASHRGSTRHKHAPIYDDSR